jgi:hypothetical protein
VPVVAGVDVGNATTEVAVLAGSRLLGAGRSPTRGGKGSAESLRGAAALVRRLERRHGWRVDEARIAPLRPVQTATIAAAAIPPATGRLRLLAAGVSTPGGGGDCAGAPLWLDQPVPAEPRGGGYVVLVPVGLGYAEAARRLRALAAAGVPVRAVLVPGDEGVLIANRIGTPIPVVDQVDVVAAGSCAVVAVEVRAPGQPLTRLADPVALGAALGLRDTEAGDAVTLCRSLVDFSNAVVGCLGPSAVPVPAPVPRPQAAQTRAEPWVTAEGRKIPLREACAMLAGWPVGAVRTVCAGAGPVDVDDLFAVDLATVAADATARLGTLGRSVVAASLHRLTGGTEQARELAALLDRPVRCVSSEPGAARLGALTTPGARPDAVVVDLGAGTIDVISPDAEVVAAGAGDLLTSAVAHTLGISLASAEWVKRGPCLRVEGAQRFEAEDGSRGFLDRPPPASAAGMLAVRGPAGLLPFDRGRSPAEWRAIRLRLKQAVFAVNLRRALAGQHAGTGQTLIVGGASGDEELIGVLLRSLPPGASVGRGNVGGTLSGAPAGHRYAAAVGLALATDGR